MSEPRWKDAGTRPLRRDAHGTYEGQRTRSARAPADYGPPPTERAPRWGGLPFARGIVLVIVTTALGTVITVVTGRDPGFLLGFCLLVGAVAASLAVRPGDVYRIIPAPALAYLVGALIAGLIHDGSADASRTAVVISVAQWIASGFVAMTIATVLVILIGGVRWGTQWRRSGASPYVPLSPRSTGSLRSTGTPRGTSSPRSAAGERSAGAPRGTGSPHGAAGQRSAGSPRSTGSPRGTGGSGRPARPPNAGGSGGQRDLRRQDGGPIGYLPKDPP